jgi:hypothetical protein
LLAAPAVSHEIVRGPYLQLGSPTGIVIRWRTDVPTTGRISFGPQPGSLTSTRDDHELAVEHEVTLSGLSPDTTYYYSVGTLTTVLAGDDEDHSFATPPTPGTRKPIRVWVLGDSGTGNASAAAVRAAYDTFSVDRRTDLWLMLGDNAHPAGTDVDHQAALFDAYPQMLRSAVLWTTLGDRDALSADAETGSGPYFDVFTLAAQSEAGGVASGTEAYYSFDHANVHFVALDSSGSDRTPGGPMVTWLEQDLDATAQEWIVAFWHHSPYSRGLHDSDLDAAMIAMRESVVPVLEAHGVDLVLTAHSNDYERSFLIDGHYGDSTTFGGSVVVNGGDGREAGDGAYLKPLLMPQAHSGTVYVVAGSAGQTAAGALDHPAMFESLASLGSLVVDIDGARLDVKFLDDTGAVRDDFTLIKGVEDADGDGIVASQDNCPEVWNPDQADFDENGSGDLCADLDGDGAVDGSDCAPYLPGVSALPGPIGSSVRVSESGGIATIRWNAAFQGHASNVYRGVLPAPGNPIDTLTCFDVGNIEGSSVDPEIPATDSAFFYVVTGVNACGSGSEVPASCASVDGDADDDAIANLADNCPTVSNAAQTDGDGDFSGDECDNCPAVSNAGQVDTDGDTQGDACDPDGDNDGVPGATDVDDLNPSRCADADSDGCDDCALGSDGFGPLADHDPTSDGPDGDADGACDAGDTCPADPLKTASGLCGCGVADVDTDTDVDGTADCIDNCPWVSNADQTNADGDSIGDLCDDCDEDPDNDIDGDGRCGDVDNCPALSNASQTDSDGDGIGDACDLCASDASNDFDFDGVCGAVDNCPSVHNVVQADADGDTQGDACDPDGDSDGVPGAADVDDLNPSRCADVDVDFCDDCAAGSDGFGPLADNDPANDGADADGDGICDLGDGCPGDSAKTAPGICGCGVADIDTDADGTFDCNDNCPTVPNPGQADADADGAGDPCDNGGTVSLEWDPVAAEGEWTYRVYYGAGTGSYPLTLDAGAATAVTVTGLPACATSYFAVKARSVAGAESAQFSNEVSGWPRPEIFSVVPPVVTAGSTIALTLSGMSFQPGTTVEFPPSVTVHSVTVSACGLMIVGISVAPGVPAGPLDFEVVNPDGVFRSATLGIQ